jgi:hypothetical protein
MARSWSGERLVWALPSLVDALLVASGSLDDDRFASPDADVVVLLREPLLVDRRYVRPPVGSLAHARPELLRWGQREAVRRAVYREPQHVVPAAGEHERARLSVTEIEALVVRARAPSDAAWLDRVALPALAAGVTLPVKLAAW